MLLSDIILDQVFFLLERNTLKFVLSQNKINIYILKFHSAMYSRKFQWENFERRCSVYQKDNGKC